MRRKVKKIGSSLFIIIGAIESRTLHIKEGDLVDIEIKKVKSKHGRTY